MTKLTYKELETKLANARLHVVPGSKWRHYKGGEYIIQDIAVSEEDNELAVMYAPIGRPEIIFVRPLSVWDDQVEWQGLTSHRFTKL